MQWPMRYAVLLVLCITGGFLQYAIDCTECDQFAIQHFKHAAGEYVFEGDYEALERDLERWSLEQDDE